MTLSPLFSRYFNIKYLYTIFIKKQKHSSYLNFTAVSNIILKKNLIIIKKAIWETKLGKKEMTKKKKKRNDKINKISKICLKY